MKSVRCGLCGAPVRKHNKVRKPDGNREAAYYRAVKVQKEKRKKK
jgi:hypothetical protein